MSIDTFPKRDINNWVFNQIACQFPSPPPRVVGTNEKAEYKYRPRNWFGEYVRYAESSGSISFEIPPPFIRLGRVEVLRSQIEELYNSYVLLFEDSIEKTLIDCYNRLARRDLVPELFNIPWRSGRSHLFGVKVLTVPLPGFHGAFTAMEFRQVEPLLFDPAVWAWHNEGPISIKKRFEKES